VLVFGVGEGVWMKEEQPKENKIRKF